MNDRFLYLHVPPGFHRSGSMGFGLIVNGLIFIALGFWIYKNTRYFEGSMKTQFMIVYLGVFAFGVLSISLGLAKLIFRS